MTFNTFDFAGVRSVQVENFGSGSIAVETGTGDDVVEGSLSASQDLVEQTTIRCDADQLRIILPPRWSGPGNAHLRLGVPDGLSYWVRAASADISISAAVTSAKIVSGSGDVTVVEAGDLECTTGSGDISVTRIIGRAGKLGTGSGDISIGEALCPVSAKSGSGDIVIRSLRQGDLRASSGSGDIAVPSTAGSVDLRSASGSLTVGIADGLPAWLDLNSVSGSVRIALDAGAEPEPGEPYVSIRARTASGEIAVFRA